MERNPDGTFRRGHKGMGGRPRNSFSVTAALERMSAEAKSVDDDGTVITRAALAARWLWRCVGSGTDRGHMLTFKERLDGFIAIRRAIEPDDRRESAQSVRLVRCQGTSPKAEHRLPNRVTDHLENIACFHART